VRHRDRENRIMVLMCGIVIVKIESWS